MTHAELNYLNINASEAEIDLNPDIVRLYDGESGKHLEFRRIDAPDAASESGYECFHCGHKSVYWQSDFDFEDFGYEGQGIVQICSCSNCGAEIEYRIPMNDDEDPEIAAKFNKLIETARKINN